MTRIRMLSLAVGICALLFVAGPGKAEMFKGTFTLPYEVQWRSATLPAGDYSFELDTEKSPHLVTICGKNSVATVMENGTEDAKWEGSTLIVERIGGRNVVTQLQLLKVGKAFNYSDQKPKDTFVAQIPEFIQYIPVEMAAAM